MSLRQKSRELRSWVQYISLVPLINIGAPLPGGNTGDDLIDDYNRDVGPDNEPTRSPSRQGCGSNLFFWVAVFVIILVILYWTRS